MGEFVTAKTSGDISVTYHNVVLNIITNMTHAEAQGRKKEYVTYFLNALEMLAPYLPATDSPKCEAGLKELQDRIQKIKEKEGTEGLNTQAINDQVLNEKCNFADEHKFYIYRAFERAKIISLSEEGELDFDKVDFDTVIKVVRNSAMGVTANLKRDNPPDKLMKEAKDVLP
jgi:hypothetical protein